MSFLPSSTFSKPCGKMAARRITGDRVGHGDRPFGPTQPWWDVGLCPHARSLCGWTIQLIAPMKGFLFSLSEGGVFLKGQWKNSLWICWNQHQTESWWGFLMDRNAEWRKTMMKMVTGGSGERISCCFATPETLVWPWQGVLPLVL